MSVASIVVELEVVVVVLYTSTLQFRELLYFLHSYIYLTDILFSYFAGFNFKHDTISL